MRTVFPLAAVILLAPWPVAYVYGSDVAAAGQAIQIQAADAVAAPTWTVFGKAVGGVKPGDLGFVDATGTNADVLVTLYLTNSSELVHSYRYLILKVGVYIETDNGEWEKASRIDGKPIPDTFITMRNCEVNLVLAGLTRYRITVDGGSFYTFTVNPHEGSWSPQFYLTVDQA